MNTPLLLNDKPAVKVFALKVQAVGQASLYDCEGDEVWVPNSVCQYNESEETLLIEEWWYVKATREGKL